MQQWQWKTWLFSFQNRKTFTAGPALWLEETSSDGQPGRGREE